MPNRRKNGPRSTYTFDARHAFPPFPPPPAAPLSGNTNETNKQLENQLQNLQQAAGQAAEYIKRLEQTNYALSVRVQAMGNSGSNDFLGGQRPPDVY